MRESPPSANYIHVREPLLAPMFALAAGIVLARAAPLSFAELAFSAAGFGLLLFAARRRHSTRLTLVCTLLLSATAGAALYEFHRPPPPPSLDAASAETVILTGCVAEPPAFLADREQFTLELEPGARARVTLYLRDGEPMPRLHYGQRVDVTGRARRTRNFGNPGAFDYARWLARQNIFWTVTSSSVTPLSGECGSRYQSWLFSLRQFCLDRLDALYPHDPWASGMMKATLIGDASSLEKIWTENFRRTGTYHALVISGMHITVLAAVLLFVLRFLPLGEFGALTLAVILAWIYAALSGMGAPVVRGAGGFTLFLAARFFYRRARILNVLAAIAIAYVAFDPEQIFDPSFQLSFLCVAMIGAFAVPLLDATSAPYSRGLRWLNDTGRDLRLTPKVAQFRVELRLAAEAVSLWTRLAVRWPLAAISLLVRLVFFTWELFVLSAVVQFGLALPMIFYFHRLSWTGLTANLVVVPLMELVVPAGFLAIATGWSLPAQAARFCLWLSRCVVDAHVNLETGFRIPDPPVWLAIVFSLGLLLGFAGMRRKTRWRWAALALAVAAFATMLIHPFPPAVAPRALELTAIDVGQGESLLVAFPDGQLMLVDGGGIASFGNRPRHSNLDIGEDVVSPYLWTRSIRRLDVIVSTHGHDDHAGGLPAIIDNFHPRQLWTGATPETTAWKNVLQHAARAGTQVKPWRAAAAFDYGGAHIEVLSPPSDYQPAATPHNNDSLVLRLTYGTQSFLLTGDSERQMENTYTVLPTSVIKLAHHGSRTSSTPHLLDAAHPAFALISAGFENSYHLPHPAIIAELEDRHVQVLRTDLDGLITIRTDGRRIQAYTYHPRQ
ncbi:MAG: ComEC/Rec2 family competence protein [Bryobacteraceae bacterium]